MPNRGNWRLSSTDTTAIAALRTELTTHGWEVQASLWPQMLYVIDMPEIKLRGFVNRAQATIEYAAA